MPRQKARVQPAPSPDNETVKPAPPADLWQRLSEEIARLKAVQETPPPGAFTREDFQNQFHMNINGAYRKLQYLQKEGVVKKLPKTGVLTFYALIDKP